MQEAYAQPPMQEAHDVADEEDDYEDDVPETQAPVEGSVEISSAEEAPLSADSLMDEDEDAPQGGTRYTMTDDTAQEVPDEAALLDRLFSDDPKDYRMSSGAAPASMTFSINVAPDEITSVRDEEAPAPKRAPAPKEPSKPKAPAPKPNTKSAPKDPREAAAETKSSKTPKAADPKASKSRGASALAGTAKRNAVPPKKGPAKVVSPEDFFNDKPRVQRGVLDARAIEALSDEALEARLAATDPANKKSRRSMKAASEDERDVSNMFRSNGGGHIPPQ